MPEQPRPARPDHRRRGPAEPLDLLIVGGLTVDRFPDGSMAPGGTVLHAARAAAAHGLRLGVLTIAGPEPAAQRGLDELRSLAAWVRSLPDRATTRFAHDERGAHRRIWLEEAGGVIDPADAELGTIPIAHRVLLGPVAGECDRLRSSAWRSSITRGAILQGWLRAPGIGEVRPRRLGDVDAAALQALRGLHVVVASREDLAPEDGDGPTAQLELLREELPGAPILVLTDGDRGLWIRHPAGVQPVQRPVPRRVDGVPTVGAGDMLAALLLAWWPTSPTQGVVVQTAERAMAAVATLLEGRRASC